MQVTRILALLEQHARAILALADDCSDEEAHWKPDADTWSVVETINHLVDEEREDWVAHVDAALYHADQPWPPIDPAGWVAERSYNQRALAPSLAAFVAAREASLRWLRELPLPDWDTEIRAPFGRIRAGDVLVAWAAHDLLHMRQLLELRWARHLRDSSPYSVGYAGGGTERWERGH